MVQTCPQICLIFAKAVAIAFFLKEQLSTTFGSCSGQLRLTPTKKKKKPKPSDHDFIFHQCQIFASFQPDVQKNPQTPRNQTQNQLMRSLNCEIGGAANRVCDALDQRPGKAVFH